MNKVNWIFSWVFGLFFILLTFMCFDKGLWVASVFSIIGALILIPISRSKINSILKSKEYSFQVRGRDAALGGIVLFFICAVFLPKNNSIPKNENMEVKEKVVVISTRTENKKDKTFVYIDEIYKLQQFTDQLVNSMYQPPYPNFERFAQVKKNLERDMATTCKYFDELVKTTGHNKSPYIVENTGCKDAVFSMMVVLFDIRDGDYSSIKHQRQKLISINANLVKKLDEYRSTSE